MITRVGVGQVRFNLPGLAADGRGAAAGRELLLRFGALDRVVAFLRLLSAERCPDEVWSGARILFARPLAGVRETFVRLPNASAQACDLVAHAARMGGGSCYTGTGRHFVPYRDARAPLGYDALVVSHEDGDVTLYGEEEAVSWRYEGEMSLERLLLRLELRRQAGGVEVALREALGPCYVSARRGLGPVLIELLYRAEVSAQAALCEPSRQSAFGPARVFWLVRIPDLPARLWGLVARTPGFTLFLPVLEDVLVAAGYQHPVHLAGCRAALRGERLLLLSPTPVGVAEVAPRPVFAAAEDLVKVKVPSAERNVTTLAARAGMPNLEVPLRLESVPAGSTRPRAALVPWAHAGWLRRVLFALPPIALHNYRIAFLRPGILVVAPDRLEGIPFGQPLEEAAPGVLVPVGRRLRPALSPGLLAERLGLGQGALCVFTETGAGPFRVADKQLEPLERRALARADLPWAGPIGRASEGPPGPQADAPEIENDPLGLMPLWGLK
jgi:hypothetical protein